MATENGSRLIRLASSQHGVFSRDQVLSCGVSNGSIARRLRAGVWEAAYPGVYRIAVVPATWKQALLAACLAWGPGAVISHVAAAALLGLGFEEGVVQMSVPRGRRRAYGHEVHRPMSLPDVDVTVLDGIPVTTPVRTLIDLATCVDAEVLEDALDDALRRGLARLPTLRRRMTALGARRVLTKVVEERARYGVTESPLERRVLRALLEARLTRPAIQYRIGRFRVDLAYVEARIAIECDGYKFHSGRRAFDDDRARRNVLTAQGWTVLHATSTNIAEVVETVRAMIS